VGGIVPLRGGYAAPNCTFGGIRMRTVLGFAVSFSLIVALAPSSAHAQEPAPAAEPAPSSSPPTIQTSSSSSTPGDSSNALTGWLIVPYGSYGFGYGIGGRFMMPFPVIPRLLTHTKFKDYWALEFGADFWRVSYGYVGGDYGWNALVPTIGLMWQVWLLPNLGVYPKAELGYEFGWLSGYNGPGDPSYGGFRINGAAGIIYQLAGGLSLRGELGYLGAKGGVAWQF
jgi:hypothetical protein